MGSPRLNRPGSFNNFRLTEGITSHTTVKLAGRSPCPTLSGRTPWRPPGHSRSHTARYQASSSSWGPAPNKNIIGLNIYEMESRRAVQAFVDAGQAEQLRELRLDRVLVGGIIKRNRRGRVIRIDVDRVQTLPEVNDLTFAI